MSENLELKVTADTGQAVGELKKVESSVKKTGDEAEKFGKQWRESAYEAGNASRKAAGEQAKLANETRSAGKAAASAGTQWKDFKQGLEDGAQVMLALSGAVKVIQELDKAFAGLAERYGAAVDAQEQSRTKYDLYAAALVAVNKGLIAHSASVDELVSRYKSYIANTQRAEETTNAFAESLGLKLPKSARQVGDEFAKLNVVIAAMAGEGRLEQFAVKNSDALKALAEEFRILGERVPAELQKLINAADEYAKAEARRAEAKKRADEAGQNQLDALTREWEAKQKLIEQAQEIIAASVEEAAATGNSADATSRAEMALAALAAQYGISKDRLNEILKSNEEYKKILDDIAKSNNDVATSELAKQQAMQWVKEQAAEYDKLAEAVKRYREAESASTNRTSKAPAEFKHIQDAAFSAAVAAGELGTNLDNVAAAVVATGGTMTVGAPYMIQYAQATREATQALLDMAVAHKGLREEQAQALEATKGWTDYILTLKDGYESGTTSLYNYVTALGAFKTQLLQMFAGAKGEAKESLQAIIDLINELVRTAGAGGRETFSQGPLGDLERAIRDANRNRGR